MSDGIYTCHYCRMQSDGSGVSCPHCGAPVNVRERITTSGWEEQPPIADMARIQFGHSTCQIEGAYVPVADINLQGDDWVYFSHHQILWCDTTVQMGNMPLSGGVTRMLGGMPLVMVHAKGPGHIAFSADVPGETIALPIQPGQAFDVHEHRFLMATGTVGFEYFDPNIFLTVGSGNDSEWEYPVGRYMDRFHAKDQPGLLLLHAPGNTFVRDLQPNERVLIQPSSLIYKDSAVNMSLHVEYPANSTSWNRNYSQRTVWLVLSGPGRIAMQSVFEPVYAAQPIKAASYMTSQHWDAAMAVPAAQQAAVANPPQYPPPAANSPLGASVTTSNDWKSV